MKRSAFFHTVDDHTCHGADIALGIVLHHFVHVLKTALAVAIVEHAQPADEDELVAVGSEWEPCLGNLGVGLCFRKSIAFESIVGGCIERVFEMFAVAGVILEIGIAQYLRPLAFRIAVFQTVEIISGLPMHPLSRIEEEHVVVGIVHLLVGGILLGESQELLFRESQMVEFVLEDDAAVVQPVHDDQVAGLHLFFGKRYLGQVVFALVRVVLGAVGHLFQRVGQRFGLHDGVALLVGEVGQFVGTRFGSYNRFVDTLPVVHVLALSPELLESLLTLVHGHLVVEVPQSVLQVVRRLQRLCLLGAVAHGSVLLQCFLSFGLLLLAFLLLFFLDERLDDTVDSGITVLLIHFC